MRHIKPNQNPGRPGFRVTFRNPRNNNEVVTAGIGRDENVAKIIGLDLEVLSNDPKLWTLDPESPEHRHEMLIPCWPVGRADSTHPRSRRTCGGERLI